MSLFGPRSIEIVEPDGEYLAAFSRSCPHDSSIRPESTFISGRSSANSISILCADQSSGSSPDGRVDDVSGIRPFEARVDAACGNPRCTEEVLNEAVELCDFVGDCLDQRVNPIVAANQGHRVQDACRTLDGRQGRAQFMRERAVERVSQELRLQMQPRVLHRLFNIEPLKRQGYFFEDGLDAACPGIRRFPVSRSRY